LIFAIISLPISPLPPAFAAAAAMVCRCSLMPLLPYATPFD